MGYDVKAEARRQYIHYFRFWFLAVGILMVLCMALGIMLGVLKWMRGGAAARANHAAPEERVYDYADVLTEQEEEQLRRYIAQVEARRQIDIVLVTVRYPVEGREAQSQSGLDSTDWEQNMRDIADDFWDEHQFGYNKGFEGDGALLLDNWYPGQSGGHLSTSGRVEWAFGDSEIDRVFDAMEGEYEKSPYQAYRTYVRMMDRLTGSALSLPFSWWLVIVVPVIVVLCYAAGGASQTKAQNTVAVNAYVEGGMPVLNRKEDVFLRKNVTSRKIETGSSGGRSGGSRSGGGGHHTSRSGASHGGGSRRR